MKRTKRTRINSPARKKDPTEKKYLITAGCSFTETMTGATETWPMHLIQKMQSHQLVSKGMGSQGNGLISRSVIYEVLNRLKSTSAENIVVGIMWSGPSRHEYHIDIDQLPKKAWRNVDGWIENPTGFIEGYKTWEIINHHWTRPKSEMYYKHFSSTLGDYIQTLEHIVRTQWLLLRYNIKYFMTTFTSNVLPPNVEEAQYHECKHLYDEIDFSKWLPVTGMHEWAKNTGLPLMPDGAIHPTTKQHKMFVDQVILPFGFK